MATIDENNDIYNGGGGGGEVETGTFLEGDGTAENPLDVKPLPTGTSTELNFALMDCLSMVKIAGTGNENPKLMWAKFPIVVQTNARDFFPSDNNDRTAAPAWTSSTNPLYLNSGAPIVIYDWHYQQNLQHIAEIHLNLGYYDTLKNFHSGSRNYTLFKTSFIQDYSNNGKFLKCVRTGSYMELEWETLESPIFEVYIDENNAANNRNVVYNDIVAALSAGKLVYLKVLDFSSPNIYTYVFSYHDVGNKELHFTLIEVFDGCTVVDYVIKDDNSYSYEKIDPLDLSCGLNESFTPPVKYNFTFSKLKQWYNSGFSLSPQIYLKYKNANGDYYKLRAVKLTTTEIMFSVYDPDTARNLSIILNDQDQYSVIT